MNKFLILLATVGVAYAGVGTLSDADNRARWAEFDSRCRSGSAPENGVDIGGVRVYCKIANTRTSKTVNREERVTVGGGRQRIFVQAPGLDQSHNILLKTTLEGTHAEVLVVPSDVKNTYNIVPQTERVEAKKPSVFYLGKGHKPVTSRPAGWI